MLTRLRLQRGEGKLLIASPKVRKRRKKDEKASSSPKGPLKATLEAPQIPYPTVEIEGELIVQEVEVVEEIQSAEIELESTAKMSGHEGTHENSEEDDVKREFKEMQIMVKFMYESFMAKEAR